MDNEELTNLLNESQAGQDQLKVQVYRCVLNNDSLSHILSSLLFYDYKKSS